MAWQTEIHTTNRRYRLGTRKRSLAGNEYIYLKGVASTVAFDAVTFDEDGVTALLAANAIGPVAFAQAAVDATTKFGWYCIYGTTSANIVANSADNAPIGRETTDGKVGDGRAAGDQIQGCVSRTATTAAAVGDIQVWYPYVDDLQGA